MRTPKINVSSNFDERPNGGVLRPPAMLMFYDFAPHGDGSDNDRRLEGEGVPGRVALCLLSVPECMVPRVAVVVCGPFGA